MKLTSKPSIGASGNPKACKTEAAGRRRQRFSDVMKLNASNVPGEQIPEFTLPLQADDPGRASGNVGSTLLASLAHEITVEAPPGADRSVSIQFDSRTLAGLHVHIERSGDSVAVRFTTTSDAVSKLLTSNIPALADALMQRGYPQPTVYVARVQAAGMGRSDEFPSGSRQQQSRQGQGRNRR